MLRRLYYITPSNAIVDVQLAYTKEEWSNPMRQAWLDEIVNRHSNCNFFFTEETTDLL